MGLISILLIIAFVLALLGALAVTTIGGYLLPILAVLLGIIVVARFFPKSNLR